MAFLSPALSLADRRRQMWASLRKSSGVDAETQQTASLEDLHPPTPSGSQNTLPDSVQPAKSPQQPSQKIQQQRTTKSSEVAEDSGRVEEAPPPRHHPPGHPLHRPLVASTQQRPTRGEPNYAASKFGANQSMKDDRGTRSDLLHVITPSKLSADKNIITSHHGNNTASHKSERQANHVRPSWAPQPDHAVSPGSHSNYHSQYMIGQPPPLQWNTTKYVHETQKARHLLKIRSVRARSGGSEHEVMDVPQRVGEGEIFTRQKRQCKTMVTSEANDPNQVSLLHTFGHSFFV